MLKQFCFHFFLILVFLSCGSSPLKEAKPAPDSAKSPVVQNKDQKDQDNDGIADELDKCPTIPGDAQYQGCPPPVTESGPPPPPPPPTQAEAVPDTSQKAIYKPSKKKAKKPAQNEGAVVEDLVKKSASLGVSYFPKMKQDETKDLSVYVDISHPEALLKEEIRKTENAENEWVQKKDTSNILTTKIDIYKSLSVKIDYDSNDFILTPIDIKQKQEIDLTHGNKWHWTIKAIAHKPVSSIRIIVDAETPDGSLQKITPRKIDIAIEIDPRSAFRTGIDYLIQHPEYTIPSILVPLVIFLFRRRKKGDKEEDTEKS